MAVSLVPAVLGTTLAQYQERLAQAERLDRTTHLDLGDGRFVDLRSPTAAAMGELKPSKVMEAHLMTLKPDVWLPLVMAWPVKKVILPVELKGLERFIALFRSNRCEVWLAINPETAISRLSRWLTFVDGVHVMTVKPGRYGAPFQPAMVQRIATLHRRFPKVKLSCDGAVSATTLPLLVAAGISEAVVGSAVMLNENPTVAWKKLKRLTGKKR